MVYGTIFYTAHASEEMVSDKISRREVEMVLREGEVLRYYPEDHKPKEARYLSRLMLGWVDERPVHVVAPDNDTDEVTIVITAYRPDPAMWTEDFRQKRP